MKKKPRVALIYDRVNTPYGGAEFVLQQLHKLYPEAPLFTSVYDQEKAKWTAGWDVRPSWLQGIPGAKTHHRSFVPFMPIAFESVDLRPFEIVISITSAEAKGVLTRPDQLHICYLLTPTRYLWSHPEEYLKSSSAFIRKPVFRYLKWWDEAASLRPDIYVPISKVVAQRCKQFYGREAAPVIYPPVLPPCTDTKPVQPLPEKFYLVVSRLVGYKKIGLAIQACQELGRHLVIVGDGPERSAYQAMSNPSWIHFHGHAPISDLGYYFEHCEAFLAPGEEDFGIAAIEAQQCGKPVILASKSGAAELIAHKKTGFHLENETVEAVRNALQECERIRWSSKAIRQQVSVTQPTHFRQQFQDFVGKSCENWQKIAT